MKTSIRVLSLLLSLLLCACMIPITAAADGAVGSTVPTTLPSSTASAYASGSSFSVDRLTFSSAYQVSGSGNKSVDLTAPYAMSDSLAGFMVDIETAGGYNLTLMPRTTAHTGGHGFNSSNGYAVFKWEPSTATWTEKQSSSWNVGGLTSGTYFIPKDAYQASGDLSSVASLNGFTSVVSGAAATFVSVSVVNVSGDPTKLPTSTASTCANGSAFTAVPLTLKSAFTVEANATPSVDLNAPYVMPYNFAGFLVEAESLGTFALSFTPKTTTRPNGHGFVGSSGYVVFKWDAATQAWETKTSTSWNVAGLTSGIYFIPKDAYGASTELSSANSLTGFASTGRGDTVTFKSISALTVDADPTKLPTSTVSGAANGAAFEKEQLSLKTAYTAQNQQSVSVELSTPYAIPANFVGFFVEMESVGAFGLNIAPLTTVRPTGNGFNSGNTYSVFKWDPASRSWTEYSSNSWMVSSTNPTVMASGLYFIPKDAYAKSEELSPINSINGFKTDGRGNTVTFRKIWAVTAGENPLGLISAAPALGKNIDMTFEARLPANATAAELTVSMNGEDRTTSMSGTVGAYGVVEFLLCDILPQEMADEMTLVLKINGEVFETKTYSIKEYAQRMLTAYPDDAELKTLLSAMLRYGASVQQWKGHHADHLATDGVTGMTDAPTVDPASITVTKPTASGSIWQSVTLRLESDIAMILRVSTDQTVTVTVNGRTSTLTPVNGIVVFDGIAASELNDTVTFTVGENSLSLSANAVLKLVLQGESTSEIATAGALYIYGVAAKNYTLKGRVSASLPQSLSSALPAFVSDAGSLLGGRVYEQGNGNYVVGYANATAAEVSAYLARLTNSGFVKKTENQLGAVAFSTFQKGNVTVYTNWNATDKTFKLTVGNDTYLPVSDTGMVSSVVTPSLVQPAREGAKDTAPGMSYVLQLADGRYIIVDGGNSNAADEQALLDYLVANKPASHEKPVIALWMITHAHGDHAGLAVDLLNDHGSEIVLEMVAHNFTDMDRNSVTNKDIDNTYAVGFLAAARKAAPSVQVWVVHSGQKVTIGGAEIEILYTPEDYFPNQIDWGNDTSCSWMITVGGKKVFFTGDSDPILCNDMARWYGSEGLQCDILQVTHHGFNGATEAFYRAIDPKICLWSCDATRFASDPRCLGTQSGYEFNQILRNEGWTRGDESGAREHYHCGETYTYNFA